MGGVIIIYAIAFIFFRPAQGFGGDDLVSVPGQIITAILLIPLSACFAFYNARLYLIRPFHRSYCGRLD